MRVLVGCEESGTVRDAFANLGHDAWSCDLLPTSVPGQHLQCDVFQAMLNHGLWDIIILHPPCTALCVSGNRTYGKGKYKHDERRKSIQWTVDLWTVAKATARIGVALENPVSVIWDYLGVSPQYLQPFHFGHLESKKTGFALHNLPYLKGTNNVYLEMMKLPERERNRTHYWPDSYGRSRERSVMFEGIAEAMAQQWGGLREPQNQAADRAR